MNSSDKEKTRPDLVWKAEHIGRRDEMSGAIGKCSQFAESTRANQTEIYLFQKAALALLPSRLRYLVVPYILNIKGKSVQNRAFPYSHVLCSNRRFLLLGPVD